MKIRGTLLTVVKILLLLVLLLAVDDYRLGERFAGLVYTYGTLGGVALVGIWLLSITALVLSSLLPSRIFRATLAIIFLVTTLLGASYYLVSDRALIYDNLEFLLENNAYLGDALTHHAHEIGLAVLLSLLSLVLLVPCRLSARLQRLKPRYKTTLYLWALSPFVILFAVTLLRGGYGVQGLPMQYRVSSLLALMAVENVVFSGEGEVHEVKLTPQPGKAHDSVVLIVEESLRADYVDLDRQDNRWTPYLYSQRGRIFNFGYAGSGANCSAESNQILRFGPNPEDFTRTFNNNPSIWQYAKKAGYRTYLLEGDAHAGSSNNRIGPGELRFIDQVIHAKGTTLYERDMDIARQIKRLTAEKQPCFILAVKNGIHFPYDKRVPEEAKLFPSASSGFDVVTRADLINSYINAVAYNIDHFFREFLQDNQMRDTVVIYTSDHGQNLLDNGHKLAHCSTEDTSIYEGLVPLFVFNTAPRREADFARAVAMNKNHASHYNIFPTVLEIFGYRANELREQHGFSLFEEVTQPRRFMSGLLTKKRLGWGKRNSIQWHTLPATLASAGS